MRKRLDTEDMPGNQNLTPSNELKELVESYIINKQNEAEYKKQASAENTQIKELMKAYNLDKFDTDLGTATLSEQESKTFREDDLIAFLKENNLADDIVKTKEYVDFDALESAIYHDRISKDLQKEMAKCQDTKVTLYLRIKAKKGD